MFLGLLGLAVFELARYPLKFLPGTWRESASSRFERLCKTRLGVIRPTVLITLAVIGMSSVIVVWKGLTQLDGIPLMDSPPQAILGRDDLLADNYMRSGAVLVVLDWFFAA